jgi:hypothetical protein
MQPFGNGTFKHLNSSVDQLESVSGVAFVQSISTFIGIDLNENYLTNPNNDIFIYLNELSDKLTVTSEMLFCVSFVCQILQFTHIVELSIA